MKKTALHPLLGVGLLGALACNSNNNNGGSPPADASMDMSVDQGVGAADSGVETGAETGTQTSDAGIPAVPALGTQIDRMGRAAVNTALNNEFGSVGGNAAMMASAGMAKDRYNFDRNPSDWPTNWVPTIEQSLAVFDGLDGVCGNQLAFGALGNPGYATLATVLANDTIWLNTASATCTTYLAVEANALGVTNTDCGGRGLLYNTIDVTFNALAGTLSFTNPPGPVTNGITMPTSPPSTTFPFLAAAH